MKDWELGLVYLALLVVKNVPPLTPLYLFVIECLSSFPSRFAGMFRFGHFGAFTCFLIFVLLFRMLAYALTKD